ncbi:hypothetical protein EYF80_009431 [Liparis tanakae]|uniref:Uncharacterized protein n=1 Tax=Liparis tanakae TaxID=230148 RepID=A0A4Z2IRL3_9TELE|nr:hypothetical protein EYF80_009431 [Liparis tanakae]
MQLSHSRDDGFFAFRVKMHSKSWVFPVGFGMKSRIASSRGWTPLFFNAVPTNTGEKRRCTSIRLLCGEDYSCCLTTLQQKQGNPSPKRSIEIHAPLLHEVDDAAYVPLQPDGDAHKGCVLVQLGSEEGKENGSAGVGAHAVQLVDESEEGDVVALHLSVHGQGLTLDAPHRTQDQHGSVQHPQRSLHFDGKVHVTWSNGMDGDV